MALLAKTYNSVSLTNVASGTGRIELVSAKQRLKYKMLNLVRDEAS